MTPVSGMVILFHPAVQVCLVSIRDPRLGLLGVILLIGGADGSLFHGYRIPYTIGNRHAPWAQVRQQVAL